MSIWWSLPLVFALGALSLLWLRARQARRRRRAEEEERRRELRLSHARWQALGEALAVGVVLLGEGHRVLVANPAARQILDDLGASPESLTRLGPGGRTPDGRTPDGRTPGGRTPDGRTPLDLDEIFARHREPRPVEIRLGDRPPRIFEAKAHPVVGGAGGEWVLALSEVTAERETERKLWLRERLAAIGQLASGIAHDFNNLLQAITLAAEISRDSEAVAADPELEENLDVILHQSESASELVRQILDFARQSPAAAQALALGPFIEEVVGLLRRTLPAAVRWRLDLGDRERRVACDPVQLQQVLTNLAVNASAAMADGGVLTIALGERLFAADEERPQAAMGVGPWVTLAVSDTGCGMAPEVRERIFEPFFSTRQRPHGSGLGLAQVYGILERQGGFIEVDSEPGRGTTFVLYLPPASGEAKAEARQTGEVEIPRGGGELVLVVEDDPAILQGARLALTSFGYRVLPAADGRAALELWELHGDDITLVLSDLVMPDMSGTELVRRIEERGSRAAVVFMTGYVQGDEEAAGEPRVPADRDRLQKPFSLEELATAISRAVRRRREAATDG